MEAASVRRGGLAAYLQSAREALAARSRVFWMVAGLSVLAAALRFATLGVQSYHHDEIVTAARILPGSFEGAMEAVVSGESTPPLYYALAWVWAQMAGTGEFGLRSLSALVGVATVPVAYLLGAELRGRRAGLAAAALVAVNPMLLWYSQEARAYSLLVLLCAVSLFYCVRALRYGRRRDLIAWGLASALALASHYFAVFPIAAEAFLLLRLRGRGTFSGLWIPGLAGVLLAPLAVHQMVSGHADWITNLSLGRRLWETAAAFLTGETGDVIGQREHPLYAAVPIALCLAAMGLLAIRADRAERRAAAIPLAVGATAIAVPLLLALASGPDFVLARNLLPALVPLVVVVAIAVTLPTAGRLGQGLGAALFLYSLGFCIWVSVSPALQRPDWSGVAAWLGEPPSPRATVTWALGEAPLRHYLGTDGAQITASEGYDWLVHEIDFVSDGPAPAPPRRLLGPGFRLSAYEDTGRLVIRRYSLPGPGLAPLRLRAMREAPLNFRENGVLLDGVGPG